MSKPLAASKKVMQNYLSELLTDESEVVTDTIVEDKRLEQLLQNVSAEVSVPETITTIKQQVTSKPLVAKKVIVDKKQAEKVSIKPVDKPLSTRKSDAKVQAVKLKDYRNGNFQAMFFKVAGLTIAVPLIELGGIHKADKTNSLMGKPDWFTGVMLYRDDKINVVDTALWVMPEKCDEKLKNSLNYQYIIMLNDSQWGLSAEHLVDTVTLSQDDVKWLDAPSKRPWLAGLVKDRMCALLDVDALIQLLNDGSGIYPEE